MLFSERSHRAQNRKLGKIYWLYARMHKLKGDFDKALEYDQNALLINLKVFGQVHPECAKNYKSIGVTYKNKGDFDKALEYYQKALKIGLQIYGEKGGFVGSYYQSVGIAYYFKKDYDRALQYYNHALRIYQLTYGDQHPFISLIHNNIAYLYADINNVKKALEYHNKALKLRLEKYGVNHYYVASSYNNIGLLHFKEKEYGKALDYYEKALKIRKDKFGDHHQYLALSLNNIGRVYFEQNYNDEAIKYYQKALIANIPNFKDTILTNQPETLKALSKSYLLESLAYKAEAFYAKFKGSNSRKDIAVAIKNYDLIFELTHEMRSDYNYESNQLLLSENTKKYYAGALLTAIDYDKNPFESKGEDKAFEYLEKSKSATLSASLNGARIRSYSNIADSLLEKEKDITLNRRYYETKIQKAIAKKGGFDTLQVQNYQDLLFKYSRQYDDLINNLKTEYPGYYKLKHEQNFASVDEVKRRLDKSGAFINYFVADTTLFITAVNNDTLVYKIIEIDSLFNQQIIDYHIDIKSDFTQKGLRNSTSLYNYLIKPVEEVIENKSDLVIIPDGNLYYVPFETLCRSENYSNDLLKLDYLIKKHIISYHQSATLWLNSLRKSEEKEANNENFLGFAPVFDPKINNGYIVSNEWVTDTTNIELATRSISTDLKHLNALPYSEKEINTILKVFKKNKKKGVGYFHTEANEENFKLKVGNYKYVHIASHSFTNDKYPALSGIAFSQPDAIGFDDSKDEDGILYTGESYNLNLSNADLVVLSSCKSGLGKLAKGEGFLSLSRGFLYAGVPNIIFSLWNVKDEQTKDLMVHFYKQVLKGKSYAEALRYAKLKLINNPKTAMPKYWAAWTLVGK